MVIRILLALIGLAHLVNGGFMVLAPADWYAFIPGVRESGPLNTHFVVDVGLAYLASGAGLLIGARPGLMNATLVRAGSAWPALHAGFHLWCWIRHGFPHDPNDAMSQVFGVVALGVLGAVLAQLRSKID